jgi:hypothetical protein
MWLTVGRWTWEHGWPPLADHFSYVTAGHKFMAHSWLSGLVLYLVEQQVGTLGLMGLRFARVSLALTATLQTARLLKAPWPAVILLTPVVFAIMWVRLESRPMYVTSLFLAFKLWLLMSVHTGQRSWRWLWGLPPLFALWINLHAGWP